MIIKNKKGISTVIANVLIVLLVIASIGIIWAVVRPTIQSAGEQVSSDCFSLLINAESCVINSTAQTVIIDVSRDPGAGNLNGIRFIFAGSVSGVLSANDHDTSGASMPNELETSSFVFNLADIIGLSSGDTVDVASVIGEQQTLCNPSGTPVACGIVATSPELFWWYRQYGDGWFDFDTGVGSPGDWPDPGCSDADDNTESTPAIGTECSDQIDNGDGDPLVDGYDPECICPPGTNGPDGPTWTSESSPPNCAG